MRSQGQVRFITISSRFQILAAGVATSLLVVWLGTITAAAIAQVSADAEQASLLHREAAVAKSENRVAAYRDKLDDTTEDLRRRQHFIEQMVQAHIGDLPKDVKTSETVSDSTGEAADTVSKYLIERAEQYQPVVEMPTGIEVEIVFLDGVHVRSTDQ